jgi:hypothetical protein
MPIGLECTKGYEYNPKKERALTLWAFLSDNQEGGGLTFPTWKVQV